MYAPNTERAAKRARKHCSHKVSGPITTVPDEMLSTILKLLPWKTLLTCEMVCRTWRTAVCACLVVLDIARFTGDLTDYAISCMTRFSNLRTLKIHDCTEIVSERCILDLVTMLPRIEKLDITGVDLQQQTTAGQSGFSVIYGMPMLVSLVVSLDVGEAPLTAASLQRLPGQLRRLELNHCRSLLYPGVFVQVTHLTRLETLALYRIGGVDCRRELEYFLRGFASTVRTLGIEIDEFDEGDFFWDDIAFQNALGDFASLRTLELYSVPVGGTSLPCLPRLEALKLWHDCHVTDATLVHMVSALQNLRVLSISQAELDDNASIQALGRLTNLERLVCGYCAYPEMPPHAESGLAFLKTLTRLTHLALFDADQMTRADFVVLTESLRSTLRFLCLVGIVFCDVCAGLDLIFNGMDVLVYFELNKMRMDSHALNSSVLCYERCVPGPWRMTSECHLTDPASTFPMMCMERGAVPRHANT